MTAVKSMPCVLVIGPAMLDTYVHCKTARLDQTAAVPVGHVQEITHALGGAANVAANLAALGVPAGLVSVLGDDDAAVALAQTISGHPTQQVVPIQAVFDYDSHYQTIVKTRVLDPHRHLMCRFDKECVDPPDVSERVIKMITHFVEHVATPSVIVLSDYNKGIITQPVIDAVVALCDVSNACLIIDPHPVHASWYPSSAVVTPNATEAVAMGWSREFVTAPADHLANLKYRRCLLTAGKDGLFYKDGEDVTHFESGRATAVDTTGAGDSVVAGLAAGLWEGKSFYRAAEMAHMAAQVVVREPGTSLAWRHKTYAYAQRAEDRIVSLAEATMAAKLAKAAGYTVGVTNGCFDLLHRGHQVLFEGAAAECDFLIALVNDDLSVRRCKGPGRPIVPQDERFAMVAATAGVDIVCDFSTNTPELQIRQLDPDVVIKGICTDVETIPGADFVKANGGRVVIVPDKIDGTTRIVERILAAHEAETSEEVAEGAPHRESDAATPAG